MSIERGTNARYQSAYLDGAFRSVYKGNTVILSRLRSRNLAFFGRTTDLTLVTSFANIVSGNYTPTASAVLVGILVSVGVTHSTALRRIAVRRGTSDLTPPMSVSTKTGLSWDRQLFLDKPGSDTQQSYALRGAGSSGTPRALAGSSITVFEMPDDVVADILTSDETVSQNTDFLSASITPKSTSAKIALNMLALVTANTGLAFSVRRGSTTLLSLDFTAAIETDDSEFPSNFEDWVDEPSTTSEVTYTLRKTDAGSKVIQKGSYLMAQEVT